MKRVLILTDGKPGHENQSRALCGALGYEYELMQVGYGGRWGKGLSYIYDQLGIYSRGLFRGSELLGGSYAAVVATGSATYYPGKVLSRQLGVPLAAILYPRGYRLGGFDCILAPAFDRPVERCNVVALPVNLSATTPEFYRAGVEAFRERHKAGAPGVAVIIGGPNKVASMEGEWVREQLERIFASSSGCERWVTTSRRTPPEVEAVVDEFPFDYKLIFSREKFNPIPAFVSLASTLYVTADSTGMLSEAVTHGGAAVGVLMNLRGGGSKFGRFVDGLVEVGAAEIFNENAVRASCKIDIAPYVERAAEMLGLDGGGS